MKNSKTKEILDQLLLELFDTSLEYKTEGGEVRIKLEYGFSVYYLLKDSEIKKIGIKKNGKTVKRLNRIQTRSIVIMIKKALESYKKLLEKENYYYYPEVSAI